MTRGKVRIIAHRRRRQGRTDHRQRLALVKSGKPRFVVRRSANSMTCQVIEHNSRGDRTIISVSSRNLGSFGWKGSVGNLPGAYLTGFLCGTTAFRKGVKEAILDLGLHASTRGSRLYSALRGCLDAGIDIPHSPDILPPVERIRGLHIEEYTKSTGKKREVSKLFDEVKKKIISGNKPSAKKPPEKKTAKKRAPPKPQKTTPKRPASRKPAKPSKTRKGKK